MDRIIQRATAENREERFESTAEFRSEILKTIDNAGRGRKSSFVSTSVKAFPPFFHQRRTFIGILLGLLVIGLSWLYWYKLIGPGGLVPPTPTSSSSPSRVEAPDDVNLFLVPGGEVVLTEGPGSGPEKT